MALFSYKAMKKTDVKIHWVVKRAREENTTNSGRAGHHFGREGGYHVAVVPSVLEGH